MKLKVPEIIGVQRQLATVSFRFLINTKIAIIKKLLHIAMKIRLYLI